MSSVNSLTTTLSSTVSTATPIQKKRTITDLPQSTTALIIGFMDLDTTARVSKLWKNLNLLVFYGKLNEHMQQHPHIFKRTILKRPQVEDVNLLKYFNALCEFKPRVKYPILEGTQYQQASLVRNWMKTNQWILESITEFALYKEDMAILPQEFLRLRKLRWVDLAHNRFTKLPEKFHKLTKLHTLYLDNNQFTEFPKELCQLNLRTLGLSNNQFTKFPNEIFQFTELHSLFIDKNPFTDPPQQEEIRKKLVKLKTLKI